MIYLEGKRKQWPRENTAQGHTKQILWVSLRHREFTFTGLKCLMIRTINYLVKPGK